MSNEIKRRGHRCKSHDPMLINHRIDGLGGTGVLVCTKCKQVLYNVVKWSLPGFTYTELKIVQKEVPVGKTGKTKMISVIDESDFESVLKPIPQLKTETPL